MDTNSKEAERWEGKAVRLALAHAMSGRPPPHREHQSRRMEHADAVAVSRNGSLPVFQPPNDASSSGEWRRAAAAALADLFLAAGGTAGAAVDDEKGIAAIVDHALRMTDGEELPCVGGRLLRLSPGAIAPGGGFFVVSLGTVESQNSPGTAKNSPEAAVAGRSSVSKNRPGVAKNRPGVAKNRPAVATLRVGDWARSHAMGDVNGCGFEYRAGAGGATIAIFGNAEAINGRIDVPRRQAVPLSVVFPPAGRFLTARETLQAHPLRIACNSAAAFARPSDVLEFGRFEGGVAPSERTSLVSAIGAVAGKISGLFLGREKPAENGGDLCTGTHGELFELVRNGSLESSPSGSEGGNGIDYFANGDSYEKCDGSPERCAFAKPGPHFASAFLAMCKAGQGNAVSGTLALHSDAGKAALLSQVDGFGRTCLHLACQSGNAALVRQLCSLGSSLNSDLPVTRDCHGDTPFHAASLHGRVQSLHALIESFIGNKDGNFITRPPINDYDDGEAGNVYPLDELRDGALRTPLHAAAASGNVLCVRALTDASYGPLCDVNAVDVFGLTPLVSAGLADAGSAVDELVKAGADVSTRDNGFKRTVLMNVCAGGDGSPAVCPWDSVALGKLALQKRIRKKGGDVAREGDVSGCVLIDIAALETDNNNDDTTEPDDCDGEDTDEEAEAADATAPLWAVARLLEAGADPNERDERGHTALHLAAFCESNDGTIGGSPGLVRLLLSAGADPNARGEDLLTPFDMALGAGHIAVAELLSRRTRSPPKPFRAAVSGTASRETIVQLQASHSACGGELTAYDAAAITGDTSLVISLEQARNNNSNNGAGTGIPRPLYRAVVASIANCHPETCEALFNCAAPPGYSEKHTINNSDNDSNNNNDSNNKGENEDETWRRVSGRTALHVACATGDIDTLRLCASVFPSDSSAQDAWGNFPGSLVRRFAYSDPVFSDEWIIIISPSLLGGMIHEAVRETDVAMLEAAIEREGSVAETGTAPRPVGLETGSAKRDDGVLDVRDANGMTALHWCARLGWVPGIECLVRNGARVNPEYCGGYTPLDLACAVGDSDAIDTLVRLGGVNVKFTNE